MEAPAGTSEAVRERGRDRIGRGALPPAVGNSGVVADAAVGEEIEVVDPDVVDDVVEGMVWYVRTGSRSTTLFGARHRRRRMRERRSSRA